MKTGRLTKQQHAQGPHMAAEAYLGPGGLAGEVEAGAVRHGSCAPLWARCCVPLHVGAGPAADLAHLCLDSLMHVMKHPGEGLTAP